MKPISLNNKSDKTVKFSVKEIRKVLSMVPDEFTFSLLAEKMNERKIIGEMPETLIRGRISYMKKMRVIGTDGSKTDSGETIYKKTSLYREHRNNQSRRTRR